VSSVSCISDTFFCSCHNCLLPRPGLALRALAFVPIVILSLDLVGPARRRRARCCGDSTWESRRCCSGSRRCAWAPAGRRAWVPAGRRAWAPAGRRQRRRRQQRRSDLKSYLRSKCTVVVFSLQFFLAARAGAVRCGAVRGRDKRSGAERSRDRRSRDKRSGAERRRDRRVLWNNQSSKLCHF
jgi:hypothetical protein